MSQPLALRRAILLLTLALPGFCWGGPSLQALIVNDGTAGLETNVTTNLSADLVLAGYAVTTNVGVPGGSLAGYSQVWDIRYNNTTPLTGSDITAYIGYMAGGGSLFVMGENTGFVTRNNTIVTLISSAGGGSVSVTTPNNNENIFAPFSGPNAVSTITFLAAAGIPSPPGHGNYVTKDSSNIGAAVVFSPGTLLNALNGSLIVVFDVNFMDPTADANSQALLKNLIAYLAAPTPIVPVVPFIPAPSSLLLLLTGLAAAGLFVARRKLRA